MLQTQPTLVQIILRYDAPLQRYACRFVKDPAVAAAIVKTVFERVYELNQFKVSDTTLRRLLKGSVYQMAQNWLLHGEGRRQTIDDGPRENRRPQTADHGRQENSQLHYLEHKNYYLLNRLKSKALSLLKTQFAKKPKNPT